MQGRDVLRSAYIANAIFSLTSAAVFVLFGSWLGPFVGLPNGLPLVVIGLGLAPFGVWLLYIARGSGLTARMGRSVSIMDANWVVGTVILLGVWPDLLNATGRGLAIGIAIVVTCFAVWQLVGSRRIAAAA